MSNTIETRASTRVLDLEKVAIGSTVELERDGSVEKWEIADHGESDIDLGVIACDSPLARAVLGAREGESRTFRVGTREWTVAVRRVRGTSRL